MLVQANRQTVERRTLIINVVDIRIGATDEREGSFDDVVRATGHRAMAERGTEGGEELRSALCRWLLR